MGVEKLLERERGMQAIWEDHHVVHNVLDALSDMIGVFRPNGELLYVKGRHPLLAVPSLTGEWIKAIDSAHRLDAIKVFRMIARTLQPQRMQYRYLARGLEWIWIEANGIPILNEAGQLDYIVVAAKDISRQKETEERLINMAYYDSLTGLPNRRLLMDQFQRSLGYARRHRRKLGLIYMDVDDFKQINDTMGHGAGDAFLIKLAEKVKACIRGEDMLARLGGDEFVVLLPLVDSEDSVQKVMQRIQAVIASPWEINGQSFSASVSCGTSVYPNHGEELAVLLRHADMELYKIKGT